MFYLLKKNTLFLKIKDNKLFLKNHIGDIKINVKDSYDLFLYLLPFLDGKNNVDNIIKKTKNKKIIEFYSKLLHVMKDKEFFIYSVNKINIENLNSFTQNFLVFCNNLDKFKFLHNRIPVILNINNKCIDYFLGQSPELNEEKLYIDDKFYIKQDKINWFVYPINDSKLKITKEKDLKSSNRSLQVSQQILKIIIAIISIEIGSELCNVRNNTRFKDSYIFDLKTMNLS